MSKPLPSIPRVMVKAVSVGVMAPWLIAQSNNKNLTKTDRSLALLFGAATIAINGYQLIRIATQR